MCVLEFDWDFVAILANKWNGGRQFGSLQSLRPFVDKILAVDSNLYGESRGTVASRARTLLVADSILVCGDILS